jgi:hypothetical protein
MSTTFDPFQDRQSRDIRNGLSRAFIEAVAGHDPEPFRREAARALVGVPEERYRTYIAERRRRYEEALLRLQDESTDVLRQAALLWDMQLFFEAHELLEKAWMQAAGDDKLVLQAMIRAAGVYIKLEYGYGETARKMSGKALPVLNAHRAALAAFFDPEPLLLALANPTLPPPILLT